MNAKRGPYIKLSEEMCAKIGKYASENGDTAAAWHFLGVRDFWLPPISRRDR